jgi:hypothetical protein
MDVSLKACRFEINTNQCGSGLARDGGFTFNISAECYILIAGKPAPTRFYGVVQA